MFKSIFKFVFKSLIRNTLLEIIEEQRGTPDFKDIIKYTINKKKGKLNFYDVLELLDVNKINLGIEYIDPVTHVTETIYSTFDTVSKFRNDLLNHSHKHNYITGIHLAAVFKHEFGEQRATEIILNSYDNKIIDIKNFDVIANPIIKWIDARPELVI